MTPLTHLYGAIITSTLGYQV